MQIKTLTCTSINADLYFQKLRRPSFIEPGTYIECRNLGITRFSGIVGLSSNRDTVILEYVPKIEIPLVKLPPAMPTLAQMEEAAVTLDNIKVTTINVYPGCP